MFPTSASAFNSENRVCVSVSGMFVVQASVCVCVREKCVLLSPCVQMRADINSDVFSPPDTTASISDIVMGSWRSFTLGRP